MLRHKHLVGTLLLSGIQLFPLATLRAQGPPINTDTPIMLGIAGRGVRTFFEVTRMDQLLQDGEEIPDPMGRSVTVFIYPLVLPFNLTPTTQIGVIAPFLTKDLKSNTGNNSRFGFGDASVFLKQLILQVDRKAETFRVAVKGSAKFPTGDDGGSPSLGSGSVDYGISAVAGWIKSRWGFYGETIYVIATSNHGADFGDQFAYNAAVGYRLLPSLYTHYPQPQLNLYLELNGNVVDHTMIDGLENPNSGGSILLISPGIQYVGGRRWLIETSVQLPLSDESNGTQLGTSWTASLGTRVLIF